MPREVKSKKSKASGLGKGLGNLMKVDSVESVLPEKEIHVVTAQLLLLV